MKLKISQLHAKDQARLYESICFVWSVVLSVVCVPAMVLVPQSANFKMGQMIIFVSAICLLMFCGGEMVDKLFTKWWHSQNFASIYIPGRTRRRK